ncbi:hypothetical protein ACFVGM_09040 [Kitasatospora purpeofusca]|uniref:hypothetical protein n=1 Tax=Kitasatospora purpeofusca TaxID=67352 RepID=UPI0036782A69
MPLVRRPLVNWQTVHTPTRGPEVSLSRSWPADLPSLDQIRASLPRLAETNPPAGRGRLRGPARASGVAPTGGPANGQGRQSIFMEPPC